MEKVKAKYKNLKFKSTKEFEKWLEKTTKYKIEFKDDGQDFLYWWLDERGEVLHSSMQSSVWNGKIVNTCSLGKGKILVFQNGIMLKHKVKSFEIVGGK